MTDFQLFKLVAGYTLFWTILLFTAIALFVALPIWWLINQFFPDPPKSEAEILVRKIELSRGKEYEDWKEEVLQDLSDKIKERM